MIDKRLRIMLGGSLTNYSILEDAEEGIDKAISQIKALVVESLGKYKDPIDMYGKTYEKKCCRCFGYNQKITEMKEKWQS